MESEKPITPSEAAAVLGRLGRGKKKLRGPRSYYVRIGKLGKGKPKRRKQ